MAKLIFSIKVIDPTIYARYRTAIAPVMKSLGGIIAKEYDVDRALHSDNPNDEITKIAMFEFPDKNALEAFFADPAYQSAKPDLIASAANISKWTD